MPLLSTHMDCRRRCVPRPSRSRVEGPARGGGGDSPPPYALLGPLNPFFVRDFRESYGSNLSFIREFLCEKWVIQAVICNMEGGGDHKKCWNLGFLLSL